MTRLKNFSRKWLIPTGMWRLLSNIKVGYRLFLSGHTHKKNHDLKNRHVGSRCFILGAGSSVKLQDITKLEGEYVISVSNTFVHPDFGLIKPRYHVLPPLLQSHGNDVKSEEDFVFWLRQMEVATESAEIFFHLGDKAMIERNGLFNNRIIHWVEYAEWDGDFDRNLNLESIPHINSVSELAITIGLYLGFDAINLPGIDHDWFNGVLVHFYDYEKEHAIKLDPKKLDFVDAEFQMRRHAEIFRKYKYLQSIRHNIFNANADPRHYLDTFPKVDFDSLFVDNSEREGASAS